MGNYQSKTAGEISYLINFRKDPIHFKINDDFPYPRKPKAKDLEIQFSEILKNCILTEEQLKDVSTLKEETKWKLICKHRYFLLTAKNKIQENQKNKTKAQTYCENLKTSESISDIDKFYEWLTQEAQESDINDLILNDGLNILINILSRSETCSRATQNFSKQLIILQILSFLSNYQQIINALIQIPKSISIIFLNFNKTQLALNKHVIQILTNVSWNSKTGPKLVLDALGFYKQEFGYKLRFEPFIRILEEAKNVVFLEMIIMFINTLVESPPDEDKREAIRSEFTTCNIRTIFKDIRDKIKQGKYKIEDSVYVSRRGSDDPKPKNIPGDPTSLLLLDENEQFEEKITSILKQIDIFEKGFEEFIEEEESDEDESSVEENEEIERKQKKKKIKKTVDFSNINDVFAKIVAKTLSTENYENFFKILQQLSLVPKNEKGDKIWTTLNSTLQDISGIKQNQVLDLENLQKLIDHNESKEELEQKIHFLDTQVRAQDDEIKILKRGKLNMEIQLKGSKKEAERYEKELNKQLESFKQLENEISELKKTKTNDINSSPDKKTSHFSKSTTIDDNKKGIALEKKQTNKLISHHTGEVASSINEQKDDSHEKILNLTKKIDELEKFIAKSVQEGLKSENYDNLQENLGKLGFSPIKQKFKTNYQSPAKEVATKKPANRDNEKTVNKNANIEAFEILNEGLSFDKNSSNNITTVNTSNFSIKETTKNGSNTQEIKSEPQVMQIIITNPQGKQSEKNKILMKGETIPITHTNEDENSKTPEKTEKNDKNDKNDKNEKNDKNDRNDKIDKPERNEKLDISTQKSSEQTSSQINKKEEKKSEVLEEIKILPPIPKVDSEVNSPSNSPLNIAPLPPAFKPGLPPALNLLNLLNKKPAGPSKEKKKPNVPMKQIAWSLVNPTNIKGTVWETIDESTVTYDISNLEGEFTSVRPDKTQAASKIPAKISLLAPNRSQNFNIILSKLKMSPSLIAEVILSLNEELLNLNMVNCLLDAIPTNDEVSLVSNYVGDMNLLENPEKYILEIKDIKNLKVRLQALQFYFTYKELFEDLELKIKKLIELFDSISREQRIIIIMKYTLAIGNYMNGESARGGAFGFKLDVFEKIIDIKNITGKRTLLSYIIDLIENNTGTNFIDVNEEFPLYEFGRKVSISQLFLDLEFIRKNIENIKIARQNKNSGVVDNIDEVFSKFEITVNDRFQDNQLDLNSLEQKYKRICEFYCEDPKTLSSENFVESFYKMWLSCKKAKSLLLKERNSPALKEPKKEKEKEFPIGRKSNVGNMFTNPDELANTIKHLRMSRGASIATKTMKLEKK